MTLPGIRKRYEGRTVLDLPPLTLADGAVHALIGANGSGKSTLVRLLAGVIRADQGGPILPSGLSVGYLPQTSYAFHMSTRGNLLLPTGRGGRARARDLLERFGIAALAGQNARRLSGGETARMAMARLMMRDWQVLLLDEPTAAMDMGAALLAERAVLDYRAATGCTMLWVTHSLSQARRVADQVLFLQEGRLVEQGSAGQVLTRPARPETRAFLEFYGQ